MSGITITADSGTQFEAGAAEYNSVARLTDNSYVVAYRDNNDFNKGKVNTGSRTGTSVTISEGNAVTFNNDDTETINVVALSSTLIVISYGDVNGGDSYVRAATISGTTITLGTAVEVTTGGTKSSIAKIDSTNFVVTAYIGSNTLSSFVGSVSGTTITLGTAQTVENSVITDMNNSIGLGSSCYLTTFFRGTDDHMVRAGLVNTGDKTISFGSALTLNSLATSPLTLLLAAFDDSHVLVATTDGNVSGYTDLEITALSVNLSNQAITSGAVVETGPNTSDKSHYGLCALNASNFLVSYYTTTSTQGELRAGTLTGDTDIAWDAQGPVVFDNGTCAYTSPCRLTDEYFILAHKRG